MPPADNPYAPPSRNHENEEVVSRQSRVIVKPDLFTKTCFAIGSAAFPVGIALTTTYGFSTASDSFQQRATVLGVIALGLSIGLLLLGVCQMRARNKAANAGRTTVLNPADRL